MNKKVFVVLSAGSFNNVLVDRLVQSIERGTIAIQQASKAMHDFSIEVKSIVDNDNRPFYQKMQKKGGKKRKQNYNNRQPWK